MRKLAEMTMVVMVLAGCGSPAPRDRCSSSAQCAAGQYCAQGGVCWPDAVGPVIDAVTVTCPTPCLRDSTVTVAVTAHDDVGVADVTASLDLAPAVAVPLVLQAGTWRAELPLGGWPFAAFERAVALTVEARDAAGNRVTASRPVGTVTRLRWVVDFAPGEALVPVPGAVAVDAQGAAVFGGSNGKVHYIGQDGVAVRAPVAVGAGFLTAPVVVGSGGVWVPSDDGKVYRVPTDPMAAVEMACDTRRRCQGDRAQSLPVIRLQLQRLERFYSQPTLAFAATRPATLGTFSTSRLRRGRPSTVPRGISFARSRSTPIGCPIETWAAPASLGSPVAAPLALRANGDTLVLTAAAAGGNTLFAVSPAGAVTPLAATDAPADGPVVRANGDIVVPERGKTLSCWTGAGAPRWRSAPLGGIPLTPLLLAGPDALVVADARGGLTALDDAGQVRWTVQLAPSGTALHPPNLYAPSGSSRSIGYVAASNGKLYAVTLDGRLDASAPWPKAFHDPMNTGNSSTAQPPP